MNAQNIALVSCDVWLSNDMLYVYVARKRTEVFEQKFGVWACMLCCLSRNDVSFRRHPVGRVYL